MSDEVRNTDDAKGVSRRPPATSPATTPQREGKVDQAGGKAKDGVEKLTDKVKDVLKRD